MRSLWVGLVASGCYLVEPGKGDDPPPPADPIGGQDASENADAPPPATVFEVTCGNEVAFVESTGGFRFAPSAVTISVGNSVQFMNPASHSIVPVFPSSDDGLRVGFNMTTCLQFTQVGTFNYRCNPHSSMIGTISVDP